MANVSQYYKVEFVFNRKLPQYIKNIMIKEYLKLRGMACDRLNSQYEKWNNEWTGEFPGEDIYSEKGRAYHEFIRSRQEPILEEINRVTRTIMTEIHSDEVCDLIATNKFIPGVTMVALLKPIEAP